MNDKNFILGKFNWQDGFGAFTYSKSQIDKVVKYVLDQPEHHNKQSFKNEAEYLRNSMHYQLGKIPICKFFKLARNTLSASLQPFRSITYTSSTSVPIIHRISDFCSKP